MGLSTRRYRLLVLSFDKVFVVLIRARIMNSPLLPRRLRARRNDPDGYQDLESFQKAQLRNKVNQT